MTRLVGLDVGTTGVKAIKISASGDVVARVEREYPLVTPRPGWVEQDPEQWWRATEAALDELGLSDVAGIGLSGQMHGLVALDRDLRVLRPAILWNDQRTASQCERIEQLLGLDALIRLTGNRALTGFTAPKLLWLRENEPDLYGRIAHVALPKDYVRLRLTGDLVSDVADASGTLLFDVANRRWSPELIEALGVDPDWLAPALESPDLSGTTTEGTPVAAGAGDQAAGAIGVGVDRPGPVAVALGTSGVIFAALDEFKADPRARVHAFCHAVPRAWHAMGVMLSAAGSLDWFRRGLVDHVSFADLVAGAERWGPGSEGATFLPYLAGERTPHADPDARGAFVGLSLRHDRDALARAVLEGVAYGLRDGFELVAELGERPARGRISGGGARSELWTRIIASVLQIPIERTTADEGAAYGGALLGGTAAGVFAHVRDAVTTCVRVRETIDPEPRWCEAYEEGYRRFRALYPALRRVDVE
jgi:xylulokinase